MASSIFHANAEHCLKMAERASTIEARTEYKELAAHWLQIAADVANLEQMKAKLTSDGTEE